jgi:dihydrofolate reductase
MTVALIAAVSRNGVIGRDGQLPWRLPLDMTRFRTRTTGHHVIMGRRTYESIGKPLPERVNLVLSRRPDYAAPGCRVVQNLEDALEIARRAGESEAFVIGGADVYAAALPVADRVYLTRVDAEVNGDVRFPPLASGEWRETAREEHASDARHAHPFAITVLERAR